MVEDEIIVEEEVFLFFLFLLIVEEDDGIEFKYLGFVRIVVIYLVVCLLMFYELVKDNVGFFKFGVENIEVIVEMVFLLLYDKFNDVFFKFFLFVDCKVKSFYFEFLRILFIFING